MKIKFDTENTSVLDKELDVKCTVEELMIVGAVLGNETKTSIERKILNTRVTHGRGGEIIKRTNESDKPQAIFDNILDFLIKEDII